MRYAVITAYRHTGRSGCWHPCTRDSRRMDLTRLLRTLPALLATVAVALLAAAVTTLALLALPGR